MERWSGFFKKMKWVLGFVLEVEVMNQVTDVEDVE